MRRRPAPPQPLLKLFGRFRSCSLSAMGELGRITEGPGQPREKIIYKHSNSNTDFTRTPRRRHTCPGRALSDCVSSMKSDDATARQPRGVKVEPRGSSRAAHTRQAAVFMSSSTVKRPPPTWLWFLVMVRVRARVRGIGVGVGLGSGLGLGLGFRVSPHSIPHSHPHPSPQPSPSP